VLSALPGVVTAQNAQNDENNTINTNVNAQQLAAGISQSAASLSAIAAASSANFRGAWSALTGALNVPASVLHNGQIWQLLTNQSNVATAVPGVSAAWYPVVGVDIASRAPIAPTLDLDFANQRYRMYDSEAGGLSSVALASILTYTGANRTFADAQGLLRVQASNVPRLTFDPITGVGKGLLIEEARTNLIRFSEQFDNAAWRKTAQGTGSVPVVTPNVSIAPDGTLSADRIVFDKGTGNDGADQSSIDQNYSTVAGSPTSAFVWLRSATSSNYLILLDFGGLSSEGVDYPSLVTVTPAWQRFEIRIASVPDANRRMIIRLRGFFGTSNFADVFIWGAQQEIAPFASSYIPTTTAAVTAPADVASLTGTNFSKWFNPVQGTFVIVSNASVNAPAGRHMQVSGSLSSSTLSITNGFGLPAERRFDVENAGVTQAQLIYGSSVGPGLRAFSASYKTNDFAASVSGGVLLTDTLGSVPVVDRMGIGCNAANSIEQLNGTISRILYFPRALPANLQSLSA
jgi:hypothetical protein